jgi:sulfate transport system substrate-binding protein
MDNISRKTFLAALLPLLVLPSGCSQQKPEDKAGKTITLLNASYDPTRELYGDYDKVFADYWKAKTGDTVDISLSNGGSGKQARAVIDGLPADVVTLGLAPDIDAIVDKAHLIDPGWQKRLAQNSSPYTSTIIFLVRKGNPKGIKDWPDLIKPGVEVVTPNPKTSGGARWNFLGAYGYALHTNNGDKAKVLDFLKALYANVKVLDTGARGSTITFTERGQGDVLIAWENDALLAIKQKPDGYDIVYPSETILAEPPVAVVDVNAQKHGTTDVATEYLNHLYSPEGQDVIARNFYRPRDADVLAKYKAQFPDIKLFTIDELFGGWGDVQKTYFGDGGVFDQIYKAPAAAPPAATPATK